MGSSPSSGHAADRAKQLVLEALRSGPLPYTRVRTYFRQASGLHAAKADSAFDQLIQRLIAEKFVGYEADLTSPAGGIAKLWLRPRGADALGAPPS